jgi:hypothetical protein
MMDSRNRNRDSIHAAEKFFHILKCFAPELPGDGFRLREACVHHSCELHGRVFPRHLVIYTGVIPAECPHTHDRYANCSLVSQVLDSLRPSVSRQSEESGRKEAVRFQPSKRRNQAAVALFKF